MTDSDVEIPAEFRLGRIIPETTARRWLGQCGKGVRIFHGCRLIAPDKIAVGAFSQIDEAVFILSGDGVSIGAYVHLAVGCSITGGGECQIDDFVSIGAGVRIVTGTEMINGGGLTNPTIPPELRSVARSRVRIGAHAVVFTNSIVFPGVRIGEGSVIAAGSLVHHDTQPWAIYGGNPLVQIGLREKTEILEQARALLPRALVRTSRGETRIDSQSARNRNLTC